MRKKKKFELGMIKIHLENYNNLHLLYIKKTQLFYITLTQLHIKIIVPNAHILI